MSLPSDVTPDIPPLHRKSGGTDRMTAQQQGWIVAALVAFLGVAYVGPAIARYRRRPPLRDRVSQRLRDTKRQARVVSAKARKRARRLGGGSNWRR